MSADLSRDLDQHRRYLLRVARLQLRDESLAEDVVQDTLAAALSGSGFSGKSSLKTWLTGVLKHKIVYPLRRKQAEPAAVASFGGLDAELDVEDFDVLFKSNGAWEAPPAGWGAPEEGLKRR